MCNRPREMMVNLQQPKPTEIESDVFVEEDDGRERVLLVQVQGKLHAINVSAVREVLRARATTPVPGAPGSMLGLINVRGMVVTVLDLHACLAASPDHETNRAGAVTDPRGVSGQSIVLLEHGSRVVGLAVDAVRDVRPLDETAMVGSAALGNVDRFADGIVRGLVTAGGDVVMLLDVTALLLRHMISSRET